MGYCWPQPYGMHHQMVPPFEPAPGQGFGARPFFQVLGGVVVLPGALAVVVGVSAVEAFSTITV